MLKILMGLYIYIKDSNIKEECGLYPPLSIFQEFSKVSEFELLLNIQVKAENMLFYEHITTILSKLPQILLRKLFISVSPPFISYP